jgi:hypothetical protein
MRPKPLQNPISASNAFHNNAMGYDAVILSGTVNLSRRRQGGRVLRFRQPSDEALQMKLGEPRRVLRQSTVVFETSNLSTLLSYKQPAAGRQYCGKKSERSSTKTT